jgi:hypothetical protein
MLYLNTRVGLLFQKIVKIISETSWKNYFDEKGGYEQILFDYVFKKVTRISDLVFN